MPKYNGDEKTQGPAKRSVVHLESVVQEKVKCELQDVAKETTDHVPKIPWGLYPSNSNSFRSTRRTKDNSVQACNPGHYLRFLSCKCFRNVLCLNPVDNPTTSSCNV